MSLQLNKTRVETLSDGIFAIILTLLVLEVKVPKLMEPNSSRELGLALWKLTPKIWSWMISFLMVCVIWVNHHRLFDYVQYVPHSLFWLNANLLLWCSLIPFPTAVLGDYINNPLAGSLFGFILSLMALAFYLMRLYMLRHPEILKPMVDLTQLRRATHQSLILGPMMYLSGAITSFIHSYLALTIYMFIPLFFILKRKDGHHPY